MQRLGQQPSRHIDNDQDGAADCNDVGCAVDVACTGDDDDTSGDDDTFGDDFADEFGEDEMDDVFEADDEEDFESGQSQVGFAAPGAAAARSAEAAWGTGVNAGLVVGSLFSVLGAFAGFELVRTMWMWFKHGTAESGILKVIGDLFV